MPDAATYIEKMKFLSTNRNYTLTVGSFTSNRDTQYNHSYVVDGYASSLSNKFIDEIALDGKYKKMKAVIAPTLEMTKVKQFSNYATIRIWADDVEVYNKTINSNGEPESFEIDLTGVMKLKISGEIKQFNSTGKISFGIGDIKFIE
ncbi:MAG TPA: NPCBM/NEW2 domain-containing protein [Patescibacteria group bacterium]|nr:NPCBM/NEW2 domain-containing protein [Patescibacteria group bacterium]